MKSLRLLLHAGAKAHTTNISGATPLMAAVDCDQMTAVRMLLAHLSLPEICATDCNGVDALSFAIDQGHTAIAQLVRDHITSVQSGRDPKRLGRSQFREMVEIKLGLDEKKSLSVSSIDQVFDKYDADGSGTIDDKEWDNVVVKELQKNKPGGPAGMCSSSPRKAAAQSIGEGMRMPLPEGLCFTGERPDGLLSGSWRCGVATGLKTGATQPRSPTDPGKHTHNPHHILIARMRLRDCVCY